MSSPWLQSKTPIGPPTAANPTIWTLLYAAAVTGGWSGLICLIIYAISSLAGVSFAVVARTAGPPLQIPWFVVLFAPLVAAVIAALLSSLVRGWHRAGRIVFWLGTLAVLASCVGPLTQPAEVGWSTRVILLVMHAITWLLVVPQIARIVGDSEPGAHIERSE